MTKFIAQLNDGSFINIFADEMKMDNNCITVFKNKSLVAFVDTSVILTAHLSEKAVEECKN